jgi:hypothetical protein
MEKRLKKRILFVTRYDLIYPFNLKQKFDNQMNAFKSMGYDISFIGYDLKNIYLCQQYKKYKLYFLYWKFLPKFNNSILYTYIFLSVIKAFKYNKFDYIYIRYCPILPFYLKMVYFIKTHSSKLVIEIPSFPQQKEEDSDNRIYRRFVFFISRYLRKNEAKYVDLYLLIGEKTHGFNLGKPALNIENGIDVESVNLRTPCITDSEIHILALANMARWHGYDRLILGLDEYLNTNIHTKITIHLIGNDGDGTLKKLKELVIKRRLCDYVFFEKAKYGIDLDNVFNRCDIGIGAIGLFRKKIDNTSELKIREYCARGIPFIYSGFDPVLKDNLEFCLKIPNDSSNVNIQCLIDFVKETRKNNQLPIKMRRFASSKMSWQIQFQKMFLWFQNNP